MDLDRACPHDNSVAHVEINRLTDGDGGPVTGYTSTIRVACADCDEPYEWIGLPVGLSPRGPTVSVDGLELRAPLRPASSGELFGIGGPGFEMTIRGGE